jgi:hypothetical protein
VRREVATLRASVATALEVAAEGPRARVRHPVQRVRLAGPLRLPTSGPGAVVVDGFRRGRPLALAVGAGGVGAGGLVREGAGRGRRVHGASGLVGALRLRARDDPADGRGADEHLAQFLVHAPQVLQHAEPAEGVPRSLALERSRHPVHRNRIVGRWVERWRAAFERGCWVRANARRVSAARERGA